MTVIVNQDSGTVYDSAGDSMRFTLTEADTQGLYTFIEDRIKPGFNLGLHLHRHHTETFYVIGGEITFTVDKKTFVASPGTTIHISPNTPHAVQASKAVRLLTIFSPAGLEGAMQAFAKLTPEQAQDPAVNKAINEQYDIIGLAAPPTPTLLNFYDLLVAGDAETLAACFSGEPSINTPLQGEVKGKARFRDFVGEQKTWLATLQAKPRFFNVIIKPERIVVELLLDIVHNGETIDLPVALVADREGERVSAIRVYHSTWPLNGKHLVRSPILTVPATKLHEPAAVEAYMAGLHEGNAPLVLSLFMPDSYFREPSGSRYRHEGTAGLTAFYTAALENGGIELQHCTSTFDGQTCAIEFICDRWANVQFPAQSGLAIYELSKTGKLQYARIYDDVMPPMEH